MYKNTESQNLLFLNQKVTQYCRSVILQKQTNKLMEEKIRFVVIRVSRAVDNWMKEAKSYRFIDIR